MATKGKDKKKRKTAIIRYENFHRFWTGLSVLSVLLTIIGSTIAGARVFTIGYRALIVFAILSVLGRILIKSWASWEEMTGGQS